MNILQKIIHPRDVLVDVPAGSKKHCLEILSGLLGRSAPAVAETEIFANLVERERLGCTGVGEGVAFPHCRVSGIETARGALMRLAEPIEFESPDGMPVDLVVGLLVPEEPDARHRADIAEIAAILAIPAVRARLRAAADAEELYRALGEEFMQTGPLRARG